LTITIYLNLNILNHSTYYSYSGYVFGSNFGWESVLIIYFNIVIFFIFHLGCDERSGHTEVE